MEWKEKKMQSIPKNKPWRSEKYKAFIRSQQCLAPGCHRKADAHHEALGASGVAVKAPDNHCLPLCAVHHRERHDVGRVTFWKRVGVDPAEEIKKLNAAFGLSGEQCQPGVGPKGKQFFRPGYKRFQDGEYLP